MAHFLLSSLHHYMDTTGCDHLFCHSAAVIEDFNPRTPCGVRHKIQGETTTHAIFQSTHPLRGATNSLKGAKGDKGISIHAPLAGCDGYSHKDYHKIRISIHAPLAGCDTRLATTILGACLFQSTHPLRGATITKKQEGKNYGISIHAPLAGCDLLDDFSTTLLPDFNPRTPCGVRQKEEIRVIFL